MSKKNNTSSEEVIEKRYRHFMILLYPEWSNYDIILQDIKGSFKNYAYVLHSPEEGEKKAHVHFLLSLDNPRTIESLSKRLDIPKNLIQSVRSLRASCRYLIHLDNEDKIQYDLASVKVSKSFSSTFFKSFDDLLSDEEILDNIYAFIDEYSKDFDFINLEIMLTKYVCSNSYNTIFKRYYSTISKYISYRCSSKT